VIDDLVYFSS